MNWFNYRESCINELSKKYPGIPREKIERDYATCENGSVSGILRENREGIRPSTYAVDLINSALESPVIRIKRCLLTKLSRFSK